MNRAAATQRKPRQHRRHRGMTLPNVVTATAFFGIGLAVGGRLLIALTGAAAAEQHNLDADLAESRAIARLQAEARASRHITVISSTEIVLATPGEPDTRWSIQAEALHRAQAGDHDTWPLHRTGASFEAAAAGAVLRLARDREHRVALVSHRQILQQAEAPR